MNAEASGAHAPPEAAPGAPMGVLEAAQALWSDTRTALAERLNLAMLEIRLAGLTLLYVVVFAVAIGVLLVTAWLALVGGVVAAFVGAGLHWGWALAIVVALNLAVAGVLVYTMLRLIRRVGLPGSLRRIAGQPADTGG